MYTLVNPFVYDARFDLLVDDYLSTLHEIVPKQQGVIWLKKTFTVPESLKGEDISTSMTMVRYGLQDGSHARLHSTSMSAAMAWATPASQVNLIPSRRQFSFLCLRVAVARSRK